MPAVFLDDTVPEYYTRIGGVRTVATFTATDLDLSAFTAGSVLFANGTTLAEDNSGLFWDDSSKELGIGTNTPASTLHVVGRITITGTGESVFIGEDAGLVDDLTTNRNIFIGKSAGRATTTGNNNIAIGSEALQTSITGSSNVAIGSSTLRVATGGGNMAIGVSALSICTTGQNNVAVGVDTLKAVTSGGGHTAIGTASLSKVTTGVANVGIGVGAGNKATGSHNIIIGSDGFQNLTTAGRAILIGDTISAPSATSNNQLSIGALIFSEGIDGTGTTLSTGNIGIAVVSPAGKLDVVQPSTTGARPTLRLEQADVSEQMITFETTIGVGNAIEAVGAKTLTTTHFIKVTLPGALTRYIPCGTIA